MKFASLPLHIGLAEHSRLAPAFGRLSADVFAFAILCSAGVLAAVSTACLDLNLRIPGHAILRGIFPMAIGLAMAPRRRGGMVMGISAVSSVYLLHAVAGVRLGPGSLTSLTLIGPCLDYCLRRVESGGKLYSSFVLAGLSCNLIALIVRAATKFGGWESLTSRPIAMWWLQAIGTYAICGVVAGLISVAVWFQPLSKSRGHAPALEPKS